MTPLGQQIARLLAPEHWEEWESDRYTINHRATGLSLWVANCPWLDFQVWAPRAHKFGLRERWILSRMARRVERHLEAKQANESARELVDQLMTAEERAIEELLR